MWQTRQLMVRSAGWSWQWSHDEQDMFIQGGAGWLVNHGRLCLVEQTCLNMTIYVDIITIRTTMWSPFVLTAGGDRHVGANPASATLAAKNRQWPFVTKLSGTRRRVTPKHWTCRIMWPPEVAVLFTSWSSRLNLRPNLCFNGRNYQWWGEIIKTFIDWSVKNRLQGKEKESSQQLVDNMMET